MNIQKELSKGSSSLLVLSVLGTGDMYGYQIVQTISESSSGRIVTQEGSLYPVLYKLQEQGMISDKKVLVGKRMTRVYYHLEEAGRTHLQNLIEEYEAVTQGVFQIIREGKEKE